MTDTEPLPRVELQSRILAVLELRTLPPALATDEQFEALVAKHRAALEAKKEDRDGRRSPRRRDD